MNSGDDVRNEMLVALKEAATSLTYYIKRYDPRWDGTATPDSTLGMVRAAIARAEESAE